MITKTHKSKQAPSCYFDIIKPVYISKSFYDSYSSKTPPWGAIGEIVFLRTYSHYIPDLDNSLSKYPEFRRREKWQEVCLRVIEYNLSLEDPKLRPHRLKCMEAEDLFDLFFNFKAFPSGRTLWVGGTQRIKQDGSANFNCSFVTVDSITKFSETFYMLLVGAGVGFSVENRYTSHLPSFNTDVSVEHILSTEDQNTSNREHTKIVVSVCTNNKATGGTLELDNFDPATGFSLLDTISDIQPKVITEKAISLAVDIVVGDSKLGWASALYTYLTALTFKCKVNIKVNYENIRPAGSRLKTFGGTASGPEPLRRMFKKIHWVVSKSNGLLSNTDCMDIQNMIAEGVVCGGVRRSSQLCLFSEEDTEVQTSKVDLWDYTHNQSIERILKDLEGLGYDTDSSNSEVLWEVFQSNLDPDSKEYKAKSLVNELDNLVPKYRYRPSRVMSNNSVALWQYPTSDSLNTYFEAIKSNGEPGFINMVNASNKRPNFKGLNPCCEILLDDRGTCNLTTRNVSAFVSPSGKFDYEGFLYAGELLVRWSLRITLVKMFSHKWDEVQHRDRLLGLSLTGICDALVKLGWDYTDSNLKKLYNSDRKNVSNEAIRFSKVLNVNPPLLSTTVKPEGTLSLLPGVSSGIHKGYAPYFIRRIRVSSVDPICKVLRDLEVPNCPENGQSEESCDTRVFTFYIKSDADSRAIDEPVESQLERYKGVMADYVDHNCSCTVTLDKETDEYDRAKNWLLNHPENYIGVSFLPKFDPNVQPYPNMPFEPITEEEYLKLASPSKYSEGDLINLISKYENEEYSTEYAVDSPCATGNCPVR